MWPSKWHVSSLFFFFFFSEGSRTRDWVSVHMVSGRSTDAATICEWLAGQAFLGVSTGQLDVG